MLEVRRLSRTQTVHHIDDLAALRIAVFVDFPYLYAGDAAYERTYLATYMQAQGAVVIGAFDGARLVGAATAAPLLQHFAEFADPLAARGLDAADFFYFGESVLLADYRGQGAGVRFFEEREAAARQAGYSRCIFSAVIRPADHPARPALYRPLDAFWTRRGYRRIEGLTTQFSWRDIGDAQETDKPMEYWTKQL